MRLDSLFLTQEGVTQSEFQVQEKNFLNNVFIGQGKRKSLKIFFVRKWLWTKPASILRNSCAVGTSLSWRRKIIKAMIYHQMMQKHGKGKKSPSEPRGVPVCGVQLSSCRRRQPAIKLLLSLSIPFVLEGRLSIGAHGKAPRQHKQHNFVRISAVT